MNYDLLWCFGRNSQLPRDYGVSFNLAIEWEESLGEVCGDGSLRCLVSLGFSQTLMLCVLPVSDSVMNENPKTPLRLVLEVSKKKSKCNFSELQGVPCYGCNVPFDVSDSSCNTKYLFLYEVRSPYQPSWDQNVRVQYVIITLSNHEGSLGRMLSIQTVEVKE